jgi:hypothetical protein
MAAADVCYRHPDRPAVAHCDVCARPVCGACLWSAESGQRLCPDHAATPPERPAAATAPALPYQGNGTDVSALVAGIIGGAALLSCAGLVWVLPFAGFILGLVALLQARQAANPRRTRWLAGVGLAGGGLYLLFIVGWLLVVLACVMPVWFSLLTAGPRVGPFPTPLPPVTPFAP